MNEKQDFSGLLGSYLDIVQIIGEIIATFFVFILTGQSYSKLGNTRKINLTIGTIVIIIVTIIILTIYYTQVALVLGIFIAIIFWALLTGISEGIRLTILEKEKRNKKDKE